jgi:hypothetical protein
MTPLALVAVAALLPLQDFSQAQADFEKAFASGGLEDRVRAIEALGAVPDPRIVKLLADPFTRMGRDYQDQKKKLQELQAERERHLPRLKSGKTDEENAARQALQRLDKAVSDAEEKMAAAIRLLGVAVPALAKATAAMKDPAPAVQSLIDLATKDKDWRVRVTFLELARGVDAGGFFDRMIQLVEETQKELAKFEVQREAGERELQKITEKYYKDGSRGKGNAGLDALIKKQGELRAQEEQYRALRLIKESAFKNVTEAADRATGDTRRQRVAAAAAALGRQKDLNGRVDFIQAFGAVRGEEARGVLAGLLQKEKDPRLLVALTGALAAHRESAAAALIRPLLQDKNWQVKAAAVQALGLAREKESVEPLIALIEAEEGRLKDDVEESLKKLTGVSFAGNAILWREWWTKNQATFTVPEKPDAAAVAAPEGAAQPKRPSTEFYGIKTFSLRIALVLDVSGSMNEDSGAGGPRIQVAKAELLKAVLGLPEKDASFNVVLYSFGVRRWSKHMVEATAANKKKLSADLDQVEADGGTNIYEGILSALELAGAGAMDVAYKPSLDTIFFLSDGQPTLGPVTDPDEILAEVRKRNRLGKVRIHTVGIGKEHNADFMRRLAEENGGTYVSK